MAQQSIDDLLANLDLKQGDIQNWAPDTVISFCMPAEYKQKYNAIQKLSKGKFCKLLKEVLKRSIDKVNLDDVEQAS